MIDDPIDHDVFTELQEATGSEFVVDLVTTFLGEAPDMLSDLRDAATQEDADRFRRAAHSIKSNANVFGASALAQLARDIELGGLGADPEKTTSILAALDQEYARTSAALKAMLDG